MIQLSSGGLQPRNNVFPFKIGKFFQNLVSRESRSKQIQYINDTDPHAPYARPAAALFRIDRDSFDVFGHSNIIAQLFGELALLKYLPRLVDKFLQFTDGDRGGAVGGCFAGRDG